MIPFTKIQGIRIVLNCTRKYFQVDRRRIAFLKFIIEAQDGLAGMTTLDAGAGIVEIRIPPGCEPEVAEILDGLGREMAIRPMKAPIDTDNEP